MLVNLGLLILLVSSIEAGWKEKLEEAIREEENREAAWTPSPKTTPGLFISSKKATSFFSPSTTERIEVQTSSGELSTWKPEPTKPATEAGTQTTATATTSTTTATTSATSEAGTETTATATSATSEAGTETATTASVSASASASTTASKTTTATSETTAKLATAATTQQESFSTAKPTMIAIPWSKRERERERERERVNKEQRAIMGVFY